MQGQGLSRMKLKEHSDTRIKTKISNAVPYLLIILFAVALIFPELNHQAYVGGLDSYFHLNSFYEDAMQIKHSQYSYFMSIFGFEKSGRAVNALYAPGFNYLMGELLLACGTWVHFYLVSTILFLSITGIGLYLVARCLSIKRTCATVLAMLYMMSHPVFSWVGNQEFTGIGAMFLPFAFLVGIRIAQRHSIKIIPLAILMTVFLQTHLLTSLMAVIILIPYTIYGFIRSKAKLKMAEKGGLAAVITFILNGNVFGSLYDLFSSNHLIPTFPQFTTQANGVKIQDLSITNVGFMLTIIFALACGILIIFMTKFHWIDLITLGISLIFLWISSTYFPWTHLERKWIDVSNTVQFPQRFMSMFWIPALLSIGVVLTKMSNQKGILQVFGSYTALAVLSIVLVFNFGISLNYTSWLPKVWNSKQVVRYNDSMKYFTHNPDKIRHAFKSHNLSLGLKVIKKQTPDYLPTHHKINLRRYYKLPIYSDMYHNLQNSSFPCHKSASSHRLIIRWHGNNHKLVTIPAVKYAHTSVKYNGTSINPNTSYVGAIKVHQTPGKNKIILQYHPGFIFKLLIVLMIIGWILVVSLGIKLLL